VPVFPLGMLIGCENCRKRAGCSTVLVIIVIIIFIFIYSSVKDWLCNPNQNNNNLIPKTQKELKIEEKNGNDPITKNPDFKNLLPSFKIPNTQKKIKNGE
jgi:hypothetical protein